MEHSVAVVERSLDKLTVSDYRRASVQVESSADGECGGWLGCGNCTIAQLLNVLLESQVPSTFISLASGRSTSATVTDDMVDVAARSWCGRSDNQCF